MVVAALAIVIAAAASVAAQGNCSARATADFIVVQNVPANPLTVNSGGEWGADGTNATWTGAAVSVVSTRADGYFFFKFDTKECWDATPYGTVQFDWSGPPGSSFDMTWTVHAANCTALPAGCKGAVPACARQPDSTYVNINATTIPDGTVKTSVIPMSVFLPNSAGTGNTDFNHIKDWTFINFRPVGATFTFNNFILKPGCPYTPAATNNTAPTGLTGGATLTTGTVPVATGASTTNSTGAATTTRSAAGSNSKPAFLALVVVTIFALLL